MHGERGIAGRDRPRETPTPPGNRSHDEPTPKRAPTRADLPILGRGAPRSRTQALDRPRTSPPCRASSPRGPQPAPRDAATARGAAEPARPPRPEADAARPRGRTRAPRAPGEPVLAPVESRPSDRRGRRPAGALPRHEGPRRAARARSQPPLEAARARVLRTRERCARRARSGPRSSTSSTMPGITVCVSWESIPARPDRGSTGGDKESYSRGERRSRERGLGCCASVGGAEGSSGSKRVRADVRKTAESGEHRRRCPCEHSRGRPGAAAPARRPLRVMEALRGAPATRSRWQSCEFQPISLRSFSGSHDAAGSSRAPRSATCANWGAWIYHSYRKPAGSEARPHRVRTSTLTSTPGRTPPGLSLVVCGTSTPTAPSSRRSS